ncbi:MAG: Rubredoxin-type Fe(Cys)4 protein [Firmicutes bacterium]|nr:Rubredoxin-type Fe(Cys)4 protein [Bacillota bacterium]
MEQSRINSLYEKIKKQAEESGYFLNPDAEFCKDLAEGLLVNQERYGYMLCPCRLTSGERLKDLDIICPCDYRDADITEFGACYCALYVSRRIAAGEENAKAIPERRGSEGKGRLPVWRCRVCGYLCARENPPEICPICKVSADRFEKFL